MQIYRPYVNIEDSVSCLDKKDLYISGCLTCPELLLAIFRKKKWIDGKSNKWLYQHPIFNWYWNDGTPFVKELIEYYRLAKNKWLKNAGAPNNHGYNLREVYLSHESECYSQKSQWNNLHSRCHKISLLYKNFFWYKRFFRKYINVDLSKFEYYENICEYSEDVPRKIYMNEIH